MGLKKYIIEKSKELNIDIVGFTDCNPLLNLKDYLIRRQKEGKETEFEEYDIEKRIDPKIIFPECESILVIGLSYSSKLNLGKVARPWGKLSKSTWGLDYHKVLNLKMIKLIEEIQKETDFEYKSFVDTGPLIDRELARRAGIGYYGKNCSIINPEYGSFIFLGYILTNLAIEKDPEYLYEECGDCTLCLKACPTGALENPYKLNPKKCISYLTQTKETIPFKLRGKMRNSIYGCDICQKVCPKNKGIYMGKHKEFTPKDGEAYVDIEKILSMTNKEFKETYGHMAGSWRGRNIWRRNGIIALGNTKDKAYLQILKAFLRDPSPMIREYAAWAILNIDYRYGIGWVRDIIEYERDEIVRLKMKKLIDYFVTSNIQE